MIIIIIISITVITIIIFITTTRTGGGGEGGLGVKGRGQRPPWKGGEQETALTSLNYFFSFSFNNKFLSICLSKNKCILTFLLA